MPYPLPVFMLRQHWVQVRAGFDSQLGCWLVDATFYLTVPCALDMLPFVCDYTKLNSLTFSAWLFNITLDAGIPDLFYSVYTHLWEPNKYVSVVCLAFNS